MRNYERIPLDQDIDTFFENEVKPFAPESYIDHTKNAVGYEINFKKLFYQYKKPRPSSDILKEVNKLENETNQLDELIKNKIHEYKT